MKHYVKFVKEVLRGLNDEVLDKTEWLSEEEYIQKRGKSEYIFTTSHKYEWVDYQEEYREARNEKQVLSGVIVHIFPFEKDDELDGLRWFIVETNAANAGSDTDKIAFSCFAKGHNARHLDILEEGQYVEVEGELVIEMMAKNESNIWFDVDTIDYEPKKMARL